MSNARSPRRASLFRTNPPLHFNFVYKMPSLYYPPITMIKYALIAVAAIVALIILVTTTPGLTAVGIYNGMVSSRNGVDQSWAEVENQYQRRSDLIPNLVQTVQGAANFEKSTFVEIATARASVGQVKLDPSKAPTDPAQLQQFEAAQSGLGNALSRLLVVSENYPQLQAHANFQTLQAQLEGTENRITTARER